MMVAGAVQGSPLGGHPLGHPFGPETTSLANVTGAGIFWNLVHGMGHLVTYPIHAMDHWTFLDDDSSGSGASVEASPPSTKPIRRKGPSAYERRPNESGRTSSAGMDSAHGFRSGKARTARGKCPKGHYWSYKLKKCVRSKY